jgi:hypothetical protein
MQGKFFQTSSCILKALFLVGVVTAFITSRHSSNLPLHLDHGPIRYKLLW